MTLRLAVALALAVGLGFVLGVSGTAYVLGAYDRHTDTVVRVCWEQAPKGARAMLYQGDADSLVSPPSRHRLRLDSASKSAKMVRP